ncbi:19663_t:CDS:2 [Cetraspora pellucida]|uniref:19663_t:CDS:1 n=1 Tax=Cetraspora pellucida TaxID=1433469 RepID=A0A9N9IYY4_9GLOM|nr:19663_t:CDS:2 [Cetraspora pellucida]
MEKDVERQKAEHLLYFYNIFSKQGYQPQYTHLQASMLAYTHINLLEMLQKFDPNEVIENIPAFFKQVEVKSDPNLYSYYSSCIMCNDPKEFFISKLEYAKWIKDGASAKIHRLDSYALLHQPEEQEI